MKAFTITLLFVFLSLFSFGQKVSKIYDSKGRLIADTAFSITKTQLKFFTGVEKSMVKQILINQVIYPVDARDANVQEILVVSFIIANNGTINDIRLENRNYLHAYDSGACSHYFLPIITNTLERLILLTNKISTDIINRKYFLEFKFRLEDNKKDTAYFQQGIFIIKGKRSEIKAVY